MEKRYGGKDGLHRMMQLLGSKGGRAETTKPKGFAANPELAKIAGRKGGLKSRRTDIKNGEGKPIKRLYMENEDEAFPES